MSPESLFDRYTELQRYVGWTPSDASRVHDLAHIIEPEIELLIDDFYEEIGRHPQARQVITGGESQIQRLKETLSSWLRELLRGPYDLDYVIRRRRIGDRHVRIGLDQVYTNAAMSRLRAGLIAVAVRGWPAQTDPNDGSPFADFPASICSLNKLLDLDLALIEDSYQSAHARRQQEVEQLVQTERLAALDEAMASLVHESRNALQRSQAGLEMLIRKVRDRPEANALILRIQEAQDDLHQLYEEVREYAAPLKLRIEPCNPVPVLHEAWEHLAAQENSGSATLTVHDQTSDSECQADRVAMRRVFRNILENSLAASPDGVKIVVSLRPSSLNGKAALEFSLKDDGPGFAFEQRARVFEPFVTSKTHGTGLGLAICKRIIDAHGGSISIGPGPGAEIIITLPQTTTSIRNQF